MSEQRTNWTQVFFSWAQAFAFVAICAIFCWTYVTTEGCTSGDRARAEIRQMRTQEPTNEQR